MSGGVTFAKIYPSDWRAGTIGILDLMEEGLYWRCCVYSYDTGNPVPLEDMNAARVLCINHNQYRAVMARLVQKGKMMKTNRGYINGRVMGELLAWEEQREARVGAAKIREENKRSNRRAPPAPGGVTRGTTPPVTPPHDPPSHPPQSPPLVTDGVKSKNVNKNNDAKADGYHYARASLETRNQKPEERERDSATAPPSEQGVIVNCEAIHGPGFSLPFLSIDLTAKELGIDPQKGRNVAEAACRTWAANGTIPADPLALLTQTLKAHLPAQPLVPGAGPVAEAVPKRRAPPSTPPPSRLDPNWILPDDYRQMAQAQFGMRPEQIEHQAKRFKQYWTSPDAKNPRKRDWPGTWRNWIERALEKGAPVPNLFAQAPEKAILVQGDMPDRVWQLKLRTLIEDKVITHDEAANKGYRP